MRLALALTVLAQAYSTAPLAEPATPLRIAVLGDSNSAPDAYFDAWHELLTLALPHVATSWHGWSGATACGDGVTQALAARQTRPDLVLVMLGTNDVDWQPVGTVCQAYDAIRATLAPTPVLFIRPPPVVPWGDKDPAAIALHNAAIDALPCDVETAGLWDAGHYRLPVDGIHLDGEGQTVLAALVRDAL